MGVAASITNQWPPVVPRPRFARCRCPNGGYCRGIAYPPISRGTGFWPIKSGCSSNRYRRPGSEVWSRLVPGLQRCWTGLLVCGACGRRMQASYRSKSDAYYACMLRRFEGSDCRGLAAAAIDDLVTRQVLLALEPAALELSLRAIEDVQQERQRLHLHWKQRLERASYEVQRAERRYQAVEPENRLVAAFSPGAAMGRMRCVHNAIWGKNTTDS